MSASAKVSLALVCVLPCGCALSFNTDETEGNAAAGVEGAVCKAAGRLAYWTRTRMKQHVCALVSAENPNGIDLTIPLTTPRRNERQGAGNG